MERRRFYRSIDDNRIAGVAGGLAEYFNTGTMPIRLLFVVAALFGPGIPIYLLLWLIVPRDPDGVEHDQAGSSVSIVLKAFAILICLASLGHFLADADVETIFVIGILVGLMFYWRSAREGWEGFTRGGKIYRSGIDKRLFGVCGGLGEYVGVDPTLLRVAGVALLIVGFGVIVPLYVIAAMIMPRRERVIIL